MWGLQPSAWGAEKTGVESGHGDCLPPLLRQPPNYCDYSAEDLGVAESSAYTDREK